MNNFFGKNDFPKELNVWRDNIDENLNAGLALRWAAAANAMEELSIYDEQTRMEKILAWKQEMTNIIKGIPILLKEVLLSPFVHEDSSKINHGDSHITVAIHERSRLDRTWLSIRDLEIIRKMMAEDLSEVIGWED